MFTSSKGQWGETRRAKNPDKDLVNIDDVLAVIDAAVKAGTVKPGDIKNLVDAFEIGHNAREAIEDLGESLKLLKEQINEHLDKLEAEMKARERAVNVYCTLCGGIFTVDTVTKISFGEAPDNAKATDTVEGHTQFKQASDDGEE